RHGWVGVSAIDVALLVSLEAGLGLVGARIDVAGIEEDGFRGLAKRTAQRPPMHEARGLPPPVAGFVATVFCRHRRHSPNCGGHKKTRTLANAKRTGIRRQKRPSRDLLASCLTWLQAGRPNHHESFINQRAWLRVKPRANAKRPLLGQAEQKEER